MVFRYKIEKMMVFKAMEYNRLLAYVDCIELSRFEGQVVKPFFVLKSYVNYSQDNVTVYRELELFHLFSCFSFIRNKSKTLVIIVKQAQYGFNKSILNY